MSCPAGHSHLACALAVIENMKYLLITILIVIVKHDSYCQSYDSIYYKYRGIKINRVDSSGFKQGHWSIYKLKKCKSDTTKEPYFSKRASGDYLNNVKIGYWYYYSGDDCDPCYEGEQQISIEQYKYEYYSDDTIIIHSISPKYEIVMNRDTSFLISKIYNGPGKVCVECIKKEGEKDIICKLYNSKGELSYRSPMILTDNKKLLELIDCGCICFEN